VKKIILVVLFSFLLLTPFKLSAQQEDPLAKIDYAPRLLPTSPFYFLKQIKERLELTFARTPEAKVAKRLEFANRRVAELKRVAVKKPQLGEKLARRYEEELKEVEEEARQLKETERQGLLKHISQVVLKHQNILSQVLEKVPQEAKEGIKKALESSLQGYQRVLELMPGIKEEL